MDVELTARARKDLRGLPLVDRARAIARAMDYAADPRAAHHDVVPVLGQRDTFRLRSGDWRIIFLIEGDTMMITRIAHRREVYR